MNTFFIAAILFSIVTTTMRAAEVEDGWRNLEQVTRDRVYTVIFRDGHCASGSLVLVSDQAVVLNDDSRKDLAIKRADVLRLSDTPSAPAHDAIYSGRSSWVDVKEAVPRGTEYLHIVTDRGDEWKWRQPKVADDSVAFEGKTVGKAEIRYVSYVRFKPLSKTEEYFRHENLVLLPRDSGSTVSCLAKSAYCFTIPGLPRITLQRDATRTVHFQTFRGDFGGAAPDRVGCAVVRGGVHHCVLRQLWQRGSATTSGACRTFWRLRCDGYHQTMKNVTVDMVSAAYADRGAKITMRPLRTDPNMVLIEGDELAFEYLGRLFLAHAKAINGCGYSLSPHGAGSAFYSKESILGLALHRLPCDEPERWQG